MLHDLACNQFRFTSPILLQMGVFLSPSADDISYTTKKSISQLIVRKWIFLIFFL